MPYVQDTIFNLSNPYIGSTIILPDTWMAINTIAYLHIDVFCCGYVFAFGDILLLFENKVRDACVESKTAVSFCIGRNGN